MTTFQGTMKPPLLFDPGRLGQSKEATEFGKTLEGALERDRSVFFGQRVWDLQEACYEALEDNWDAYGAVAPSSGAYETALLFVRLLPSSVPNPEVSVDPDGEVSFEWYHWPRATFSVSVGPTGRLSYAGLFGKPTTHGTESIAEGLPQTILDNLARLKGLVAAT